MINVMCIFIFVNWDTLVPWAYQLCCLPSINNTIQYETPDIVTPDLADSRRGRMLAKVTR